MGIIFPKIHAFDACLLDMFLIGLFAGSACECFNSVLVKQRHEKNISYRCGWFFGRKRL